MAFEDAYTGYPGRTDGEEKKAVQQALLDYQ